MPNTAVIGFRPSPTLLSRLLATVDRWLVTYAETTIRNGDILRCNV